MRGIKKKNKPVSNLRRNAGAGELPLHFDIEVPFDVRNPFVRSAW